jgi:hypothetical protein
MRSNQGKDNDLPPGRLQPATRKKGEDLIHKPVFEPRMKMRGSLAYLGLRRYFSERLGMMEGKTVA